MNLLKPLENVVDAAANAWDMTPFGGGLADRRPTPSAIIDAGPQRTVHRYRLPRAPSAHSPVLLVPPLAAPASCFDLRRGCSVAEHLISLGYPTYLVDYGAISFQDRQLGLEHWVEDVIPNAIRTVSDDAGGVDVQVVGWCLGGIMALLSAAGQDLPVRSIGLVASPFDFSKVTAGAPIRQLAELTGGRLVTALYTALGGAPAPLVSLGFQLTALDKRITKPLTVLRNIGDRELLAQIEAVDDYMANMLAYPGRTFAQLYHRFFRVNDLADGRIAFAGGETIHVADVDVPVLVVAGENDVLAPHEAVHHVAGLLTSSPDVRVRTAPGGHLGVLTGRSARDTTWHHLDQFLRAYDEHREVPDADAAAA
ncbi:MAG: poly[(R)-3-hydroxyalkanoate] polymerase subunit PhaC [Thermoleophilaceae bacterium]|nr:poly[(R)-3-hydroxyalkanoate] polymerase subunit PhaC [Thermoleophilaceae bacterium]